MKYALLFAATAAAYDAYGGHGAPSSSVPAKISSSMPAYGGYGDQSVTSVKTTSAASKATPCSTSVGKDGYTTVVPGYGKDSVTVTTQHQAYPTCISKGYDGKSCDKWGEDKYVSTTITDYNKKVVTITKVQDYVTVYQEKKTITHSATPTVGGYGAVSTSVGSHNSTGTWYELYEKIHAVQYEHLNKENLVGYSGSGLCQACEHKQPVLVKEYMGGKWTEEKKEFTYGKPQEEVKVYEKPGVYSVPAKVVTVDYPVTYIDVATKTAKAGETCVYGGQYKDVKSTGTITGAYGAVETKVVDGKTVTVTVTKTATVFCGKVGKCEISPETTTVYDKDTKVVYPTGKVYEAGIYHYDAKVVTITEANQAYTCKYDLPTPSKTPSKGDDYPATVTKTPANNDYGYKASATPTPKKEEYPSYPSYPIKSNTTSYNNGYADKPTSTPVAVTSSRPYGGDSGYDAKSTPIVASSKPYNVAEYGHPTPSPTPSTPVYGNKGYGDDKPSASVPSNPSSTPCDEDKKKPTPTPAKTPSKGEEYPAVATKTPAYKEDSSNGYGDNKATPTPVKPVYPVGSNTGYAKRAGIMERRQAVAEAQNA